MNNRTSIVLLIVCFVMLGACLGVCLTKLTSPSAALTASESETEVQAAEPSSEDIYKALELTVQKAELIRFEEDLAQNVATEIAKIQAFCKEAKTEYVSHLDVIESYQPYYEEVVEDCDAFTTMLSKIIKRWEDIEQLAKNAHTVEGTHLVELRKALEASIQNELVKKGCYSTRLLPELEESFIESLKKLGELNSDLRPEKYNNKIKTIQGLLDIVMTMQKQVTVHISKSKELRGCFDDIYKQQIERFSKKALQENKSLHKYMENYYDTIYSESFR